MSRMICGKQNRDWRGLYSQTFDIWHPDAFQHPAKMSPALCFKIIEHLEGLGLLNASSNILDFMAGIGTTNICAGLSGHRTISIELEEKFINLSRKNKEYTERKAYRELDWTILQGDARQLSSLLQEKGLIGVVSPPYGDGTLPMGVSAKIRSLARQGKWAEAISLEKEMQRQEVQKGYKWAISSDETIRKHIEQALEREEGNYSAGNEKQIANLPDKIVGVVSPPYSEAQNGGGIAKKGYRGKHMKDQGKNQPDKVGDRCGYMKERQGESKGQIGNLPDRVVGITSPPYEGQNQRDISLEPYGSKVSGGLKRNIPQTQPMGDSEGQIAKERDETYLSAMLKCYQEAVKCCEVLVIVVKDPTRGGKIRRLGRDTCKLLRMADYKIIDYHRAILFEEQERQSLFGESERKVKGRLSFFKRLAWQKGSEIANFEHVIIAHRAIKEANV